MKRRDTKLRNWLTANVRGRAQYQVTSKQRRRNQRNYVCDITDKSPGNVNEKGQLACEHPGSKKPWNCYVCDEQLATNKLFESHCYKMHRIKKFLYFCKCGFNSETSKSTGTHMRYCVGMPPVKYQMEYKCDHCKFSSSTNNGLQVHLGVSYKSIYNEKMKEKEKNYKWTIPEYEYSAATIIELKKNKDRNFNQAAGEKLGRTEEAIQKIRTGSEYKRAERKIKDQLASQQTQSDKEVSKEVCQIETDTNIPQTPTHISRKSFINEVNRTIDENQEQAPVPVSRNSCASEFIPEMPRTTITRQLPVVPPTPIQENRTITIMLLQQGSLAVRNTQTQKQRLPLIPNTEVSEGTKQLIDNGTEETCENPPTLNINDNQSYRYSINDTID